jgi:hypothetical protein
MSPIAAADASIDEAGAATLLLSADAEGSFYDHAAVTGPGRFSASPARVFFC